MESFQGPYYQIPALIFYFIAYFLRSFRFWVIYNDSQLSLRKCFAIIFFSAVLGYWLPVFIAEVIALGLFISVTKNFARVLVTHLLIRSLDLLTVSLIAIAISKSDVNALSIQVDLAIALASLLVTALVILSVISLPVVIRPLRRAIVLRAYHSWHIQLLRLLHKLQSVITEITKGGSKVFSFILLLTISVWLCDFFAASALEITLKSSLAKMIQQLLSSSQLWIYDSFQQLFSVASDQPVSVPHFRSLKLSMTLLAGPVLLFILMTLRKRRTSLT